MASHREPGPVCSTHVGFDFGTLVRTQSPVAGPVCEVRIASSVAVAATHSKHTTALTKPTKKKHRKRRPPLLKPTAKVMEAVNTELGTKINFDKLADFEGGQQLQGYIPGHAHGVKDDAAQVAGRSGVTIGTGFDIGQWSESDLTKKLELPLSLRDKYKRYCGKQKQSAIDELEKDDGLSVTKTEADETDMKVQRYHLIAAMASWDAHPKAVKKFVELTPAQQTVILSRTYHQGIGMPKTKIARNFYDAGQKDDWVAAEKALRNYPVTPAWYKARVRKEADYLAEDLRQQKAPAPSGPKP